MREVLAAGLAALFIGSAQAQGLPPLETSPGVTQEFLPAKCVAVYGLSWREGLTDTTDFRRVARAFHAKLQGVEGVYGVSFSPDYSDVMIQADSCEDIGAAITLIGAHWSEQSGEDRPVISTIMPAAQHQPVLTRRVPTAVQAMQEGARDE